MGVEGLWQLIEPAATTCTLNSLSLNSGYSSTATHRVLRIGVDISVIMNGCIAADRARHQYQYTLSGAVNIFFWKLCRWLRRSPVVLIFVYDGPNRPSFKRNHHINTSSTPKWASICKSFVEAFGFYWHQAPGEAEAKLAMLNEIGALDLIITNDSDAFVFGATHVLRSISKDEYRCYSIGEIEDHEQVQLTRPGMVLISVLSGGDYSSGLQNCGVAISTALARCGFGERLVDAYNLTVDSDERQDELQGLIADIKDELQHNSKGYLNRLYPDLANRLSINSLGACAVEPYLSPVTSRDLLGNVPHWIQREPVTPYIAQLCSDIFNWTPALVAEKFRKNVWPGTLLRMVISPLLQFNNETNYCLTPCVQAKLVEIVNRKRSGSEDGQWVKVTLSTENLLALVLSTLNGRPGEVVIGDIEACNIDIWVSTQYIPAVLHSLISTTRKKKSTRRQVKVEQVQTRAPEAAPEAATSSANPLVPSDSSSANPLVPSDSQSSAKSVLEVLDQLYPPDFDFHTDSSH